MMTFTPNPSIQGKNGEGKRGDQVVSMPEIALRYNLNENGNNIKGSQQKNALDQRVNGVDERVEGLVGGWMENEQMCGAVDG